MRHLSWKMCTLKSFFFRAKNPDFEFWLIKWFFGTMWFQIIFRRKKFWHWPKCFHVVHNFADGCLCEINQVANSVAILKLVELFYCDFLPIWDVIYDLREEPHSHPSATLASIVILSTTGLKSDPLFTTWTFEEKSRGNDDRK